MVAVLERCYGGFPEWMVIVVIAMIMMMNWALAATPTKLKLLWE